MTLPTIRAPKGLATYNSGNQQKTISSYMSKNHEPCNNIIKPMRSSSYTESNLINKSLHTTTTSTKVQLNIKSFLPTKAKISTPPACPLPSSAAPSLAYIKHHTNIFPPTPVPETYL
jgi:hypothetical protein